MARRRTLRRDLENLSSTLHQGLQPCLFLLLSPFLYLLCLSIIERMCLCFFFSVHACLSRRGYPRLLIVFFTSSLHNRIHTSPALFVLFFNLYSHERVLLQRFGSTDRNEDLVLTFVLLMFEYPLLKCVRKEHISTDVSIVTSPSVTNIDELLQPRFLFKPENHKSLQMPTNSSP